MSPICARPSCMALTMSVPVSTTSILASTPCFLKKPFSAPMNIGRWPKLFPMTTSSLGKSAIDFPPDPPASFRESGDPAFIQVDLSSNAEESDFHLAGDDRRHLPNTCGFTQFGG